MLQIVKSLIESSSDSSESDDDAILTILDQLEEADTEDKVEPAVKRSKYDIRNKYFGDIIESGFITAQDFKVHFNLSRSSFEVLLRCITSPVVSAGRPPMPMKECLLITIWVLKHNEPYRTVSERFDISIGHCVRIFHDVCTKLFNLSHRYITWPTVEEAHKVIEDFNDSPANEGFPNVLGCLGVTHILIPASQTDLTYYDKKGNNSIILQAVCNARQELMNINVGWPGSAHYAHVWIQSGVYSKIKDNPGFIPDGTYLIGNGSYPLDEFLLVPFRENDCDMGRNERVYNAALQKLLNLTIQKAFGRLKALFKRLQYLNVVKIDNVKHIVTAACILHNLSIRDGVECNQGEVPYQSVDDLDPVYHIIDENSYARDLRVNIMKQVTSNKIIIGMP